MSANAEQIARNVQRVRERIADAEQKAGRPPGSVHLVAVVKYVGADEARAVVAAGCSNLGESRPQQLWQKAEELADLPVRWHMIGHLQRNKVRRTLPLISLLHSGDSLRLLQAVDEAARDAQTTAEVLLEINISGEAAKHGFAPQEVAPLLPQIAALQGVQVRGLMGMAGVNSTLDEAQREFCRLRELRDALRRDCPPQVSLDELSMGMSGDFPAAIAEGATLVRVGSALLEGVQT